MALRTESRNPTIYGHNGMNLQKPPWSFTVPFLKTSPILHFSNNHLPTPSILEIILMKIDSVYPRRTTGANATKRLSLFSQ
jgi:hypothetical protein